MARQSPIFLAPAAVLIAISLSAPAAGTGLCHADPYTATFQCVHPVTNEWASCYYVHDECVPLDGCQLSEWVYVENNGLADLQRCDAAHDDNCVAQCESGPDLVIF